MRKILLQAFITVNFFFIPLATAYSSDWIYAVSDKVGDKHYIDLDSIRFNRPIVTFWAQNIDRKGEETKTRYSINCENGTGTIRDIIIYNSDGIVLKSYSRNDGDLQWMRITPDSFMDGFQKILCKE